ncbi:MAG: hypothetical protein WC548_04470 [Candidatus Pacearchaeota archaeon]
MKHEIPWIGYRNDLSHESYIYDFLSTQIERAGHKILRIPDSRSGIEFLRGRHYSSLILSDFLQTGGLRVPIGIDHSKDPMMFAAYVSESIGEISGYENSQIIMPHLLIYDDIGFLRLVNPKIRFVDFYDKESALKEILELIDDG